MISSNYLNQRVGNFRLLNEVKLSNEDPSKKDENPKYVVYTACDLEGKIVTCNRLRKDIHEKVIGLFERVRRDACDDPQEAQKYRELIFPPGTRYELKNQEKETQFFWFFKPDYGSLHAYVIEQKKLPEPITKNFFIQICRIVEFLHNRGISCLDIKLRNFVFVDEDKKIIKLGNLTNAEISEEGDEGWNFQIKNFHCCPAYAPPEIFDQSKIRRDGRLGDVWSLGVLLYMMLVGRYPFYGLDIVKLIQSIREQPVIVSQHDLASFEARMLIRLLLKKNPNNRPLITEILSHSWITSTRSNINCGSAEDQTVPDNWVSISVEQTDNGVLASEEETISLMDR